MEPIHLRKRLFCSIGILLIMGLCGVLILNGPADDQANLPANAEQASALTQSAEQTNATASDRPTFGSDSSVHPRSGSAQRVFRIVLDGDRCALEAVEEVRGDFKRRRGAPDVHSGMIVSRLVDASGTVVAEEFTHAPDHVCTVLDSNPTGTPVPVQLSGDGPHVFQVRFPRDLDFSELQIHRITQTEPGLATELLLAAAVKP